ncbi:MAG TPA: helix-turn-helix domain-containing protein [Anaerolineae bacterium]|nr:helix-turn-helix domain-containing protein [Anaerolineae bacterium]
MAAIGEIVTSIREGLGLRKGEFARVLGVSAGAVTRWENGTRTPTTEQIGALLRVAQPEQQRELLEALGIEDVEQFAADLLASAGVELVIVGGNR